MQKNNNDESLLCFDESNCPRKRALSPQLHKSYFGITTTTCSINKIS